MNNRLICPDLFGLPPIEEEFRHLAVDEYKNTLIKSLYSRVCGVYSCIVAALMKSIVSRYSNNDSNNNNLFGKDVKSLNILHSKRATSLRMISLASGILQKRWAYALLCHFT